MFLIITLRILLVYSNIQANIAIKRVSFINKPLFPFWRSLYEVLRRTCTYFPINSFSHDSRKLRREKRKLKKPSRVVSSSSLQFLFCFSLIITTKTYWR